MCRGMANSEKPILWEELLFKVKHNQGEDDVATFLLDLR